MENYLELLAKDLKKLWEGLDLPKKAIIVALGITAVAAISFIVVKSTEPDWGVLYSELNETDAIAIAENLKEAGYPFKFSDDRTTILVPAKFKEELRIMIAENDIIKDSTPGFDLLNKIQFGATDFQNKLTKQKIYQDELTNTIEKIKGIKKARVQLAEPDRSVFSNRDELPSASVMLILNPGTKLKIDQIKAIKNLVAYGIPRLKPENVFVTDQNGLSLTDKITENSSGLIDYKKEFEKETSAKVQKVLQKIVGFDNVSVEVSADINFDRAKKTVEKYIPSGLSSDNPTGILTSSRQELETYGKGEKDKSSLPDVSPGIEGDSELSSNDSKKTNYQKTRSSRDYKVSKEIQQVVYAPGKIERMSIAVALNKILTSEQKEEIKALVASASGANFNRGDTITVTGMQFAAPETTKQGSFMTSMETMSYVEVIVKQLGPLLVVLVLGLGALFVLNSMLKKPLQGEEIYGGEGYEEETDEFDTQELLESAAAMPAIEANLDPELEKMKNEINNTIIADPSAAARLLLSYIKD